MLNVKEMFKLLKSVNSYLEAVKEVSNISLFAKILSNSFPMEELFQYRGIRVFEATEYMMAHGLVGAAIALSFESREDSYIVVDTLFLNSTEEEQLFLLAHEYGHFLNPPTDVTTSEDRIALAAVGSVCPEELVADKAAAEIVGKDIAIASLKSLIRTMKVLDFLAYAKGLQPEMGGFPTAELSLRIAKLKEVVL